VVQEASIDLNDADHLVILFIHQSDPIELLHVLIQVGSVTVIGLPSQKCQQLEHLSSTMLNDTIWVLLDLLGENIIVHPPFNCVAALC
jgi:hypothetical protein